MIMRKSSLSIILLIVMVSCNLDNGQGAIPYVPVNISLNLQNVDFQPLSIDGGFVYVTGGVKGILVYRENSASYLAFERSCTYEPNSDCARIRMDSSLLFMIDTCCSSQFNLEGNVLSGVAPYALRQYSSSLNGTTLNINN